MRYVLKPHFNPIEEVKSCVLKDKEVTTLRGNPLKNEINKEIETWLQYGKIKESFRKKYPEPLNDIINNIIKKYHKKYHSLWEQGSILEAKYKETDLEEMEEAYEMTMAQVQREKNKLFFDIIIPELNKELKEKGFI